jgi:hypothetical protein
MFSLLSLRRIARSAFILLVVLFLTSVFLLIGCRDEPEADPISVDTMLIPTGSWTDDFGSGYNITNSTLEYYTAETEWEGTTYPGENTKGNIKEAVNFSQSAGVLLVQITESSIGGINDKFIGVYYKDYTSSHVFLANAIDESYNYIVMNTLAEAKNTFTVDNVDTHVTYWGSGYNK